MTHHLTADAPCHVGAGQTPLLRLALRENAAFSALTGAFFVAAGSRIDHWVGLDPLLLIGGGVGLVAYAALLWWGSRDRHNDHVELERTGRAAVLADLSWVVGALGIVLGTGVLTGKGELALLLLSVPVAALAIAQIEGLRRLGNV